MQSDTATITHYPYLVLFTLDYSYKPYYNYAVLQKMLPEIVQTLVGTMINIH